MKEVASIRERSLRTLPPSVSTAVADQICANTNLFLSRHMKILGFILLSTNVRNAFEAHFPLKRLVRRVISRDAKLVLSSEWDFEPFTYPMNIELLPEYILVGGPAPESSNLLIIPLAGHEIGHSAWSRHDFSKLIRPAVTKAIAAAISSNGPMVRQALKKLGRSSKEISYLQNTCLNYAMRQLEEGFCDCFGLYVFGEGYLCAYEYFLAPGEGKRSAIYPSALARVRFLRQAASELELKYNPVIFDGWIDSAPRTGSDAEILALADIAVEKTVLALRKRTFEFTRRRKVAAINEKAVDRVLSALKQRVPDSKGATLPEVVTAGWRYLRGKPVMSDDEYGMLNELMLKSIEVSEFRLRVGQDAEL